MTRMLVRPHRHRIERVAAALLTKRKLSRQADRQTGRAQHRRRSRSDAVILSSDRATGGRPITDRFGRTVMRFVIGLVLVLASTAATAEPPAADLQGCERSGGRPLCQRWPQRCSMMRWAETRGALPRATTPPRSTIRWVGRPARSGAGEMLWRSDGINTGHEVDTLIPRSRLGARWRVFQREG